MGGHMLMNCVLLLGCLLLSSSVFYYCWSVIYLCVDIYGCFIEKLIDRLVVCQEGKIEALWIYHGKYYKSQNFSLKK